jgi:hypothetical protein
VIANRAVRFVRRGRVIRPKGRDTEAR